MKRLIFPGALVCALACAVMLVAGPVADGEVKIGSYATSLSGRMKSQRHNAELALDILDGHKIAPGETFSFNQVVGTCSRDQGYKKAPVSYNGQLLDSWGGGVCQTSTTLYNAALLSGMEIIERNRHRFAPSYVPAGRDAAVAYDTIDLKFRNPYPSPVTIHAKVADDRLIVSIWSREAPRHEAQITQDVRQVRAPQTFELGGRGKPKIRNSGKAGYEVATYRIVGGKKELLSVDDYPAMHKIVERPRS
jgi:vancomycin resistance protein VanW